MPAKKKAAKKKAAKKSKGAGPGAAVVNQFADDFRASLAERDRLVKELEQTKRGREAGFLLRDGATQGIPRGVFDPSCKWLIKGLAGGRAGSSSPRRASLAERDRLVKELEQTKRGHEAWFHRCLELSERVESLEADVRRLSADAMRPVLLAEAPGLTAAREPAPTLGLPGDASLPTGRFYKEWRG